MVFSGTRRELKGEMLTEAKLYDEDNYSRIR
jgi:hypothetical protein